MKDLLTPVHTPFSLANRPSAVHSHRSTPPIEECSPTPTEGLPSSSEENKSQGLLVEKLSQVVGACCRSQVSSPIDLVPNEILSLILELGYFGTKSGLPDKSFRALASDISRRFREVALQTPSLWAAVHLTPSNVFDELEFLPNYLERSKSYPLDIHLSCFWASDLTEQVMELMTPHSKRWRRLSITIMNDHALKFLEHVAVPTLNFLAITYYSNQRRIALPTPTFENDLPQLQFLSLRHVDLVNIGFTFQNLKSLDIRGYGIWPTFSRLNEMLGQSTNLQRLILHVKPAEVLANLRVSLSGGQTSTLGQIYLPALEYLMVYTSEWLTQDIADFIKLFTAPRLKAFVLQESVSSQLEKANTIITYLVQSKRSELFSLNPVWAESWKDYVEIGRQGQLEGTVEQPALWVNSAALDHACNAVALSVASRLTALGLSAALFPPFARLKEVFASLKNLRYLSLFNFVPAESLASIRVPDLLWENMVGMVDIPTLESLVLVFRPTSPRRPTVRLDIDLFLCLFNIPSLSLLLLKNLTFDGWRQVVDAFRQMGIRRYPKLKSLKVVDFEDSIPAGSFVEGPGCPISAFPILEVLLLDGVSSNCFLQCLLAGHIGAEPVWPHLTSLMIANDPCASRPLLHRAISARESFARPLKRLYLDSAFARNAESLEWMREQVPAVVILPPRPPRS